MVMQNLGLSAKKVTTTSHPRPEDGKGSKQLLSRRKKNHQFNVYLKHLAQRRDTGSSIMAIHNLTSQPRAGQQNDMAKPHLTNKGSMFSLAA